MTTRSSAQNGTDFKIHENSTMSEIANHKSAICHNHNNNRDQQDGKILNPIEIHQIIDLTDKPIRLERNVISWPSVRTNASNCICCCYNNSITLVTTNESYILDHIPLDDISCAQASHSLQNLAMSNESKLAIVDLVNQGDDLNGRDCEHKSGSQAPNGGECIKHHKQQAKVDTKFVNLASYGLTMSDILFWRWLDETTLAILSSDSLYTCSLNQPQINHPAMSALAQKTHLLSMTKVCDIDDTLTSYCQITDIQRDQTTNLYAISGICDVADLAGKLSTAKLDQNKVNRPSNISVSSALSSPQANGSTMRPSFGSVPSRLSQMISNDHSFDSVKSEHLLGDSWRKQTAHHNSSEPTTTITSATQNDPVQGLVQVHCCMRDCSQLILAHAVAFTAQMADGSGKTILVSASKLGNRLKVHFVNMITEKNSVVSCQQASPSIEFDAGIDGKDYPTSIICSHLDTDDRSESSNLHIAMITTKFGQMIVCSIRHRTILFTTRIATDVICGVVHESRTRGLMVICCNGQVLLVQLNQNKLLHLLDESRRRLRHISSCHNFSSISNDHGGSIPTTNATTMATTRRNSSHSNLRDSTSPDGGVVQQQCSSLDNGLEVLISTKL